ncbi:MAG: hypothetical protein CVV41_18245 [Candidatus Riflebacteria bacterium HGW-Riflebacteria-1]|jgi:hypothetical protein|nr:MAG: hypothetical protein CVV41_18245 [Candidatus Riflebacteria bacterium HGW-Riflebacteria-1]
MEKVTFAPLIALLQENAEALNQSLSLAGSGARKLNAADVAAWFTAVIEPVFEAVHKHDLTRSRKVFDVLFRDMLSTLPSAVIAPDFEQYKDCRLLLRLNPRLSAGNPARVLGSLATALKKIARHSQTAARSWIELMQKIVPLVTDLDGLLTAGRIAAWRCGMAHLRELAAVSTSLDPQITASIFADKQALSEQLQQRWDSSGTTVAAAAGGFSGYGGPFTRPPRVSLRDGLIVVADDVQTRVLFADRFGHVLLDCPDDLKSSTDFAPAPFSSASAPVAKILARYKDITSWVHHDSTLYLTTESSHAIFVFGAIDG